MCGRFHHLVVVGVHGLFALFALWGSENLLRVPLRTHVLERFLDPAIRPHR